ncbi:MFS transporter [Leucobacter sp. CSA1]|uniref:MFS transporter n=1 Tax=Leucobacter chromiisoli TaxID=2796471 RepID=A0A934Q7N5_9MICO|nr:MFS transporter [Leucobacter chromiisoli]MBK0418978.1 MFS transporter [Leucobacter chromiisoli]
MSPLADRRRARVATMIAFATNGALPATLMARYAEVKELLGIDAAVFGIVVVGYLLGAAGAFQLPGAILRRLGSRGATSTGTVWIALALVLATLGVATGQLWLFVVGLVLAGFGDAAVDVAENAQGLRVQEAYGRSLLSSMHAGWSVGAAVGGVVGTVAGSLGVPLLVHVAAWGVVCVVAMTWSGRFFLADAHVGETADPGTGRIGARALRLLIPLALVALAGIAVEDIGNNWSAVLLATERGVPVASAGIGLSVLLGAQFAGRLVGDRFIDRVGNRAALLVSLVMIAGGFVLAAWAPWAWLTLAGLALAGFGSAVTIPLAFAGADAMPGLRPHAGVTWISWIMRVASLGLSPAVGGITTAASLPVAISAASLLALLALVFQLRRPR